MMFGFYFSDSPLDLKIKSNMISDLFSLTGKINVPSFWKANMEGMPLLFVNVWSAWGE